MLTSKTLSATSRHHLAQAIVGIHSEMPLRIPLDSTLKDERIGRDIVEAKIKFVWGLGRNYPPTSIHGKSEELFTLMKVHHEDDVINFRLSSIMLIPILEKLTMWASHNCWLLPIIMVSLITF